MSGHLNEVMSIGFSPDGQRLVSASLDFTGRIWDVPTASRDRTALLWNVETGLPASHSLLHEQGVRNVAFSPDSKYLFTSDFRGLRMWDVATAHPVTTNLPGLIAGGTGFQTTAGKFHLAPDARAVLAAGDSYEAKLWNFAIPSQNAPTWFPEFLESVVGQRFDLDQDRPKTVPVERFLQMQRQLRESTNTDDYTIWARRWLRVEDGAVARD